MMAVLTPDAQGVLERYLRQMRLSLRGHTSLDLDEVERDVHGHIDTALSGLPEPVDAGSLQQVLDKLGVPEQWVRDDDLPTWRRALARLRTGPEDWRLAYLTFICFLAGPALFLAPVDPGSATARGPLLWPLPIILPVASFMLARASLAVLAARHESIETRRWLIYPALLLFYVPMAVALLGWPLAVAVLAMAGTPVIREWTGQLLPAPLWVNAAVAVGIALGVWWIVLGLLIDRFRSALRATFWPFAERVGRPHAIGMMLAGGTIVALGTLIAVFIRR